MAVYKDKNGTWYVSARYTNWKGEADRKVKRGFETKREGFMKNTVSVMRTRQSTPGEKSR